MSIWFGTCLLYIIWFFFFCFKVILIVNMPKCPWHPNHHLCINSYCSQRTTWDGNWYCAHLTDGMGDGRAQKGKVQILSWYQQYFLSFFLAARAQHSRHWSVLFLCKGPESKHVQIYEPVSSQLLNCCCNTKTVIGDTQKWVCCIPIKLYLQTDGGPNWDCVIRCAGPCPGQRISNLS